MNIWLISSEHKRSSQNIQVILDGDTTGEEEVQNMLELSLIYLLINLKLIGSSWNFNVSISDTNLWTSQFISQKIKSDPPL